MTTTAISQVLGVFTLSPPGAQQLVETSSKLIREYLKAQISNALSQIRSDRVDAVVTTEVPRNYFFYEKAQAYEAPAVFIIAQDMDFRKEELGANHINAITHYNISIVVEDRAEEYLTTKAWRYQAALHKLLDQTQLANAGETVKIVTVVKRATFSPTFVSNTSGSLPNAFRREVMLEVDAHHFESF